MMINIKYKSLKQENDEIKNILILEYDNKVEELDMSLESIKQIEDLNDFILQNIIENEFVISIPEYEDTTNWEIANKIKKIYDQEITAIKLDLQKFETKNNNEKEK